jgi:hypothetical protein
LRILLSIPSSFLTSSKENIFPSQQFQMKVTKLSTSSLKRAKYLRKVSSTFHFISLNKFTMVLF